MPTRTIAALGLLVALSTGTSLAADGSNIDGGVNKKTSNAGLNTNGTVNMPKPGTKMVLAEGDRRKTHGVIQVANKPPLTLDEIVLGNADAPITIIEYGSPTCGHCASFHNDTLPKLKENYIDTGKAKLIFRPFMLNGIDVYAGMLLACVAPERREAMLDVIFKTQEKWVPYGAAPQEMGAKAQENLSAIARQAGMSAAEFDACLTNEDSKTWLQTVLKEGQTVHRVNSTPTFVIDGDVKANMTYENFAKALDQAEKKR